MSQKIDDRLSTKIKELQGVGVRNVREMERHLSHCVKSELFRNEMVPASTNRRYFPTRSVIRAHMNRTCAKNRCVNFVIFYRNWGGVVLINCVWVGGRGC